MQTIEQVDTPDGPGRLTIDTPDAAPRAVLLLGHGAGGGIDTLDLAALAAELPAHGFAVARYEQPWRVAGRRVAGPPASLDRGWAPSLDDTIARFRGVPLAVGGRSAGARVACRCFAAPASAVVALSFPLHPPGKPERSRVDEFAAVPAPALLVSGDRDPFGSPDEFRAALAGQQGGSRELVVIPGSAHSFRQPRRTEGVPTTADAIVAVVAAFLAGLTHPSAAPYS